jgi:hypothetical protein
VRGLKDIRERKEATAKEAMHAKDHAKKLQRAAIKEAPQDAWFSKFENSPDPIPDSLEELDIMIADVTLYPYTTMIEST